MHLNLGNDFLVLLAAFSGFLASSALRASLRLESKVLVLVFSTVFVLVVAFAIQWMDEVESQDWEAKMEV